MGFPNGSPNKESAYKAGDTGVADWIPGLGKSPVGRNGNPCSILAWKIPWTEEPGRLQSKRVAKSQA